MKIVTALLLVCSVSFARADDKPPYNITVTAREAQVAPQPGDPVPAQRQILIETKIAENKTDGAILSAPRVSMLDGSQAQVVIGEERAVKGNRPGDDNTVLMSGVKVEITKPLDKEQVLVVTTIMKDGKITFADAQWAKVQPPAKP